MVTLGSVEFLIEGLKGIQTWAIIFIFFPVHDTSPLHKVEENPETACDY